MDEEYSIDLRTRAADLRPTPLSEIPRGYLLVHQQHFQPSIRLFSVYIVEV